MNLLKNIWRLTYTIFFILLILAPAVPLAYLYAIHSAAIEMAKTKP